MRKKSDISYPSSHYKRWEKEANFYVYLSDLLGEDIVLDPKAPVFAEDQAVRFLLGDAADQVHSWVNKNIEDIRDTLPSNIEDLTWNLLSHTEGYEPEYIAVTLRASGFLKKTDLEILRYEESQAKKKAARKVQISKKEMKEREQLARLKKKYETQL